jgi:hypothetical protein
MMQDGSVKVTVLVAHGAIDRLRQSPASCLIRFRKTERAFATLVRWKCREGRFEADGMIRITGVDVLRAQNTGGLPQGSM